MAASSRRTARPAAGRRGQPKRSEGSRRPLQLERVDEYRWRIARDERRGMRVAGLVYADAELMAGLRDDPALEQVANVATLPGIVGDSLAMPDIHWGYGFPVGGVAATRTSDGVVSPGGIGFDINCGVRLLRSDLDADDIRARAGALADELFRQVPSGLGGHGRRRLSDDQLDAVLADGAGWAVEQGLGSADDLERTEERGRYGPVNLSAVSARARARGRDQLGTLGSGNHFLEVAYVERVLDEDVATGLGLRPGGATVMIHCGSRGLGHQVCTDHVAVMDRAVERFGIALPDRQLACAPLDSDEARRYLGAMAAAANFAWANRQLIAHAARQAFARVFAGAKGDDGSALGLRQVYDLSHNMAKIEEHAVGGRTVSVCVHRKGATRAFPAGRPELPAAYREIGQPVLIPGDMGRASYVAVAARGAMAAAFGSTCHGAGRLLSRHAALRQLRGVNVARDLASRGIEVRCARPELLAEEASVAYKDVDAVVAVAAGAGMITPVARLRPLVVVKG